MATPLAHKGVTAGAKVQAMTLVDLLLKPEVVTAAWDYFRNVQTRDERVKLVYRVKIGLHNPDGLFKPGMPAEARF